MRFIQPVRFRVAVTYAVGLSIVAAAAVVPWKLTAADAPPAADNDANGSPAGASKPAASQPVVRMDKTGRGKFISFQDGTLVVNSRSGETLAWSGIFDDAKGLRYDAEAKAFQPMTAVEALSHAQPGAWIQVIIDGNNKTVRVGERKQQTIGTFMSFKDERLLIMLKDTTPTSYTKKYGFQVHFNKFFPNVPVYESIDGGPYQLIGIAENSLGDVKEGTIVTVHAAGDDNITMVQIGVPKMP